MPKLFRNLAPTSFFDPTNAWEAEKERMAANEKVQGKKVDDPVSRVSCMLHVELISCRRRWPDLY